MSNFYMHLLHGRDTAEEDMEDWGYDGPVLGPFNYIHITYMGDIKFSMPVEDFRKAFPDEDLKGRVHDEKVEGHFTTT